MMTHKIQPMQYIVRDATVNDLKTWQEFLGRKTFWEGVAPEAKRQAESAVKLLTEALRSRTGNDIIWVLAAGKAQAFFSLRRYESKGWKPMTIHTPHVVLSGHGAAPWHFTPHKVAQRGWGTVSYQSACEVAKRMNFSQLFWLSSSDFYRRRGAQVVAEHPAGKVLCAELKGIEICTEATCPLVRLCNHASTSA
jgi:hypothetical protein